MTKHINDLDTSEIIKNTFGGKIRIRVCGVLIENNKYLLANHLGINILGDFWCAPGGGLEFGEKIEEALKREFLEEANLEIEVVRFLDFFEYIKPPLHAVELFFEVKRVVGILKLGHDPETGNDILKEIRWFSQEELSLFNRDEIHPFYHNL